MLWPRGQDASTVNLRDPAPQGPLAAGLTAAQHQLLLAIRGHPDERGPTIGGVAAYLLLRQNSAVGLIDRADAAGLVLRERDSSDHRVVRLRLTEDGSRRLETLSELHLQELERLSLELPLVSRGLEPAREEHSSLAADQPAKRDTSSSQ